MSRHERSQEVLSQVWCTDGRIREYIPNGGNTGYRLPVEPPARVACYDVSLFRLRIPGVLPHQIEAIVPRCPRDFLPRSRRNSERSAAPLGGWLRGSNQQTAIWERLLNRRVPDAAKHEKS
jgi:hypothetical protein